MGLKLSAVRNEERTTTLTFPSGTLEVTYRPNVYTPAMVSRMAELAAQAEDEGERLVVQNQGFLDQMVELLVRWDLEDDDGDVVPIEAAALAEVPFPIFRRVMEHIGKENDPGEAPRR